MARPLLFVGDIHLGRSPHRLGWADLDPARLDPAEAWRRIVRYAVDNDVQAVVLAGDVVDQDKDRFEAWGHLSWGVERLLDERIAVLGVAGNHDHIALPRLADRIDDFRLLGRGGRWERVELEGVDLIGWSFPARHHRDDPLRSEGLSEAVAERRSEALLLGVFHGDLGAKVSPYAPVRLEDLADQPVAGWFLGHIHSPGELGVDRPIGYLGSLIGLDRGETGPRGPWLVTPRSSSSLSAEQLALGPVHWVTVEVDVSTVEPGADAEDKLHAAVSRSLVDHASFDGWFQRGAFDAVGVSVQLVGRTRAREETRRFAAGWKERHLQVEAGDARWAVVALEDRTEPAWDLEALAEERTPLGQIARLLVELEDRGLEAVPEPVRAAVVGFDGSQWTTDAERHPPRAPESVVRRAAFELLDALWAQRSAQGVG